MGEVGIVFSREAARLSREDKDWCCLLEVCQVFGTLIGDAEQVYDLALMDDQLILGIKGTMSVVESLSERFPLVIFVTIQGKLLRIRISEFRMQ